MIAGGGGGGGGGGEGLNARVSHDGGVLLQCKHVAIQGPAWSERPPVRQPGISTL